MSTERRYTNAKRRLRASLGLLAAACLLVAGLAFVGVAVAHDGAKSGKGGETANPGGDGKGEGKKGEGERKAEGRGKGKRRKGRRRVEAADAPQNPVADAYVRADQPTTNFGRSSAMKVDGSPVTNGFLRFDVDVPSGAQVTKATLKLYTADSSGSGITVHGVSDNSWNESDITHDNAPDIGDKVGESGAYSGSSYVSIDVTSLVTGGGPVSMALKRSSSTANWFNSREAASNPPQLIVETDTPSPPPPGETLLADAYVRADQANTNFGNATLLKVDGSPVTNGFLRFDVDVPSGEVVTRATLQVYTSDSSGSGITVHRVSDNGWEESSINFDNAPAIGDKVASSGAYLGGSYASIDVTSMVTGSGPVSMALKRSSTTANWFNSREASNPPLLMVETGPPPPTETVVYALGNGADGGTAALELANYVKSQNPDRFFYLGDVYPAGSAVDFATNYDPLYGSIASITDPVIGNHDYPNRTTGYYAYWMAKRGWTKDQAKHRSYVDRSGWQVIAYSSENVSTDEAWVGNQLAKHTGTCRIVMGHKGRHIVVGTVIGDTVSQEPVWARILGNTAINLVAHSHLYGRLEPIDGVNVLVSGAGGHELHGIAAQHHAVADYQTGVPTVTRLVLRPGAADFQQVDKDGTVYDSGTIACTPAG